MTTDPRLHTSRLGWLAHLTPAWRAALLVLTALPLIAGTVFLAPLTEAQADLVALWLVMLLGMFWFLVYRRLVRPKVAQEQEEHAFQQSRSALDRGLSAGVKRESGWSGLAKMDASFSLPSLLDCVREGARQSLAGQPPSWCDQPLEPVDGNFVVNTPRPLAVVHLAGRTTATLQVGWTTANGPESQGPMRHGAIITLQRAERDHSPAPGTDPSAGWRWTRTEPAAFPQMETVTEDPGTQATIRQLNAEGFELTVLEELTSALVAALDEGADEVALYATQGFQDTVSLHPNLTTDGEVQWISASRDGWFELATLAKGNLAVDWRRASGEDTEWVAWRARCV